MEANKNYALNGLLLKYSGVLIFAYPGAFGGVDSSCRDVSLSNSMISIIGLMY